MSIKVIGNNSLDYLKWNAFYYEKYVCIFHFITCSWDIHKCQNPFGSKQNQVLIFFSFDSNQHRKWKSNILKFEGKFNHLRRKKQI